MPGVGAAFALRLAELAEPVEMLCLIGAAPLDTFAVAHTWVAALLHGCVVVRDRARLYSATGGQGYAQK